MKEPKSMDVFGVEEANTANVSNNPRTSKVIRDEAELPDLTNYNLTDDVFFSIMMQQKEFCKLMLEIILDKTFVDLEFNQIQATLQGLPGYKSIRLDVYAEDVDGNRYNVEMQKLNNDNMPKRSRFYQALLDTSSLLQGKEHKYHNMANVCIIFITDFDPFDHELYKYTFTNKCEEALELPLGDGATRIFLNLKGKNSVAATQKLQDLLHFIKDTNLGFISQDLKVQELVRITSALKNSKKVREQVMSTNGFIFEAEEKARAEGRAEGRAEVIQTLITTLQEFNLPKESILTKLQDNISLTKEEALEYYNKYSN